MTKRLFNLLTISIMVLLFNHLYLYIPSGTLRLSSLDISIPGMTFKNYDFDETFFKLANIEKEDIINRYYFNSEKSEDSIQLLLMYFPNQRRSTVHKPTGCFEGQGWDILKSDIKHFSNTELKITKLLITKDGLKYMVYYWYMNPYATMATEFDRNIGRLYYGVFKRNSELLWIRIMRPVHDNIISSEIIIDNFTYTVYQYLKEQY